MQPTKSNNLHTYHQQMHLVHRPWSSVVRHAHHFLSLALGLFSWQPFWTYLRRMSASQNVPVDITNSHSIGSRLAEKKFVDLWKGCMMGLSRLQPTKPFKQVVQNPCYKVKNAKTKFWPVVIRIRVVCIWICARRFAIITQWTLRPTASQKAGGEGVGVLSCESQRNIRLAND